MRGGRTTMRLKDQIKTKSLRRLHRPQPVAIERLDYHRVVVDGFDGIRKCDAWHRSAARQPGADRAVDEGAADKGTSRVVDKNEPGMAVR